VTEKDCRVDSGGTVLPVMVKPTEIELNRLEVLRKNSVLLDREIQQKVDQADINEKKARKSK
jgi:hypothetical protein